MIPSFMFILFKISEMCIHVHKPNIDMNLLKLRSSEPEKNSGLIKGIPNTKFRIRIFGIL